MNYELWVMNYELWGMSYELWGMNYEVWVRGKVVKLKYFASWKDSSLRYASFRMTRFCFLLTIRNLYYWGIFLNRKDFFSWIAFFKWAKLAKLIRYEAMWWRMKDEGWGMRGKVDESWRRKLWVMSYELWGMSAGWSREVEIFCFLKRFFTTLRFVQNDRVVFFTRD